MLSQATTIGMTISRGFFANFTYAAAHQRNSPWRRQLHDMPWDWRPWRRLIWKQVKNLRDEYHLTTLGGLPKHPQTHQRLSFFEIALPGVPLTVLGLDNGVA